MAEPFNHERLEAVITRALRLRADAEPRDGLEERVIATMRSQAVAASRPTRTAPRADHATRAGIRWGALDNSSDHPLDHTSDAASLGE